MTHYLACSICNADSEIFIVEGKSALNALDQVRSRAHQAVFAVQGKLPNAARHSAGRLLKNPQASGLLSTLGYTAEGQSDCQFSQVLLATDPDADGHHCRWLMLALLQRFCRPLLESGRVRVVSAPMFRVGDKDSSNCEYFWSEHDKQQFLANRSDTGQGVTTFKGLASLSSDELHRWVVAASTRRYASAS